MFIVAVLDELCNYILVLIGSFHLLLFSNNTVRLKYINYLKGGHRLFVMLLKKVVDKREK
jgi:hypothetical protein